MPTEQQLQNSNSSGNFLIPSAKNQQKQYSKLRHMLAMKTASNQHPKFEHRAPNSSTKTKFHIGESNLIWQDNQPNDLIPMDTCNLVLKRRLVTKFEALIKLYNKLHKIHILEQESQLREDG